MKKTKLILPFLRLMFRQPSIILKALYHTVVKYDSERWVKEHAEMSGGLPQIDILKLFPDFNETVDPFTNLYGTSLPIDLAVLKRFAARFPECNYLEIGTWRGESLANVSPLCKHCVSISLSDEDMGKFGWGKPFQKMQRIFSKHLSNVTHIEANSRTMDFSKLDQKFDLIFVDGDHSYEGVASDSKNVMQLLRDQHSIIIWHDYTSNYEHINWEVFRGILAGVPKDKHHKLFHISNTLCAVYLNDEYDAYAADYPAIPVNNFITTIHIKKMGDRLM